MQYKKKKNFCSVSRRDHYQRFPSSVQDLKKKETCRDRTHRHGTDLTLAVLCLLSKRWLLSKKLKIKTYKNLFYYY